MLTDVRAFIRARAKSIGLTEWTDAFNFENIPSTIADRSFHMEMTPALGIKLNQRDQEIDYPLTVRIFVKGYRTPAEALDKAIQLSENLLVESLDPLERLVQPRIKNVVFETLTLDPIDASNDNLVVASVGLRVFGILGVET